MMDEHLPRVSFENGNQQVEEIRSILLHLKDIQTKPAMAPLWDRETSVQSRGGFSQVAEPHKSNDQEKLGQLLKEARILLGEGQTEKCRAIMEQLLDEFPEDPEARWYVNEYRRLNEEERLRDELEIHVEDTKKSAMDLFEQERYQECVELFGFLSDLEPENHTLRDYFMLSQQMEQERALAQQESTEETTSQPSPQVVTDEPLKLVKGAQEIKARRKYKLALMLVVLAILFPAILSRWTSRLRSTRPVGGSQPQQQVLMSEDKKRATDPKLGAVSGLGERNPQSASQRSTLTHDDGSQNAVDHEHNDKGTNKSGVFGRDSNQKRIDSREPAIADPIKSHESKPTETSGGNPSSPSGKRDTSFEKLKSGFTASVIHDHVFGSCRGELRLNSSSISFKPIGATKHAFDFKLSDIIGLEMDETLRIKSRNRTYRFKAAPASFGADNLTRLNVLYSQMVKFWASVR